ncbi:hypothetical protein ASF45_24810 [Pseudorhodoferax sp. Leaf265]|nr:hypothetical protein ASF45_24810 [Pseudorhodoferax sp. Leaf265]
MHDSIESALRQCLWYIGLINESKHGAKQPRREPAGLALPAFGHFERGRYQQLDRLVGLRALTEFKSGYAEGVLEGVRCNGVQLVMERRRQCVGVVVSHSLRRVGQLFGEWVQTMSAVA